MICLLPTLPRKIRNGQGAVTPRPLLNPTTMKGSGESMGKANSVKLSLEEQATKVCTKCGEEKSLEAFYASRTGKYGRIARCKKCVSDVSKYNRANNIGDAREKNRRKCADYWKKNRNDQLHKKKDNYLKKKPEILKKQKEYRKANKDKVKLSKQKERKKNNDKYNERSRRWRSKNAEHAREYQKQYRKDNADHIAGMLAKWRSKQLAVNPDFRIKENLRARLVQAIKKQQKLGSAVRDLGCSLKELKKHLESQFDSLMSWENWGTYWHIDHIFPLNAADLEDRVQFLAVNNWRNLQPLEAKANLAKGDKVTPAARRLFNKLVKEFS